MPNVYLAQPNNSYGDSVFLPYSVGMLQAYAQSILEIRENFDFKEFIFLREDISWLLSTLESPAVLGISCYIWNFNYTMALAQAVKTGFPDCLVVAGGPHVPNDPGDFFVRHPYIDIAVHGEGELTFADILLASLSDSPDYVEIAGLSLPGASLEPLKTPDRGRLQDLSVLPSPYLHGVFNEIMRNHPELTWDASQETHRGCPYQCTFCDWGSAVFTKVRKFEEDRIVAEYRWMAMEGIDLLYNCDANYGLFPNDEILTHLLAATKAHYGYPRQFRAAYAKNSNKRVFTIASTLNQAEMCKGVTLSFQSLDPHTLELIKRQNMDINDFAGLVSRYRDAGIPTYTEMILGLPGETYDSFVNGLVTLLEAGQHDSINIYPCMVLPNSEMADPAYQAEHGIETVVIPDLLAHSVPADDPYLEQKEIIIGTKTMPVEDWRRAYLFGWAVQCFHSLGLTSHIAASLHKQGVSYQDFYEALLKVNALWTHSARMFVEGVLHRVLSGGPWDTVFLQFGLISWPPEEATFLHLVSHYRDFYGEIYYSLADLVPDTYKAGRFFTDIFIEQEAALLTPERFEGSLEDYAREIVWYGRKSNRTKIRPSESVK